MSEQGRMSYLIDKAIDALDNYSDPFHESFLQEHDVSADEVCALSDAMSAGLQFIRLGMSRP